MGVLDKFLNAMKMNDDDGFDTNYLDDEYDEEEEIAAEERPKKRLLSKYSSEDYDDVPVQAAVPQERSSVIPKTKPVVKPQPKSKISPMRQKRNGSGMEVCVIRPKSMEDAREITETLLEECTVVLNMEGLDLEIAQRIIDFASGSCYAVHGNLQKISNYIFIITPENVDISGDFPEILSGAFEVPAFGTKF